jgi:hypothetical protein
MHFTGLYSEYVVAWAICTSWGFFRNGHYQLDLSRENRHETAIIVQNVFKLYISLSTDNFLTPTGMET